MNFTQRRIDHVQIITFIGCLTTANVSDIRKQLRVLIHKPDVWFILDLSQVKFMDAEGLALLIFTLKCCQQLQGDVLLLNPNNMVRTLLELTRLQHSFMIFLDESAAIMYLKTLFSMTTV